MRDALRMLTGLALAAGLAGCRQTAAPVPLAELTAQQAHGHTVFQTRCAVCHYDRREGPLHGPALVGVFKKKELPSGTPANDDRVTNTILHGRNLMPAAGSGMEQNELDDLLAYLHTL